MGYDAQKRDKLNRADYELDENESNNRKRDRQKYAKQKDNGTGIVISQRLKVREQPNETSEVLAYLTEGDFVFIEKVPNNKDWVCVFNAYGISGYCKRKFIGPAEG